jgi:hypothetical protein
VTLFHLSDWNAQAVGDGVNFLFRMTRPVEARQALTRHRIPEQEKRAAVLC